MIELATKKAKEFSSKGNTCVFSVPMPCQDIMKIHPQFLPRDAL